MPRKAIPTHTRTFVLGSLTVTVSLRGSFLELTPVDRDRVANVIDFLNGEEATAKQVESLVKQNSPRSEDQP